MSSNELAFFIGLFGSMHCIGMCGPLALAVPVTGDKWWLLVLDKVLYNIGRITTYGLLGLVIGLIGRHLWIYGLQQVVCIGSGILIVMAASSRIFKLKMINNRLASGFFVPIGKLLTYALQHHAGHFAVGLINGLLPCGFVYLALAGAINTSSPGASAQFMLWFGMGTFPLMLIAMAGTGLLTPRFRTRVNKAVPYLMIVLGCWFIIRGLDINIPYLSPQNPTHGAGICR